MQVLLIVLGAIIGILIGNQIRRKLKLNYKPIYPQGLICFLTGVLIPIIFTSIVALTLIKLKVPSDIGNLIFSADKGFGFGIVLGIFFF